MRRNITSLLTGLLGVTMVHAADLKLWYDKPAAGWANEALPIGNGRLGAMVFGDAGRERIQFNEESLWIGDEDDTGAYQAFGDLFIVFDGGQANSSRAATADYRRELDLARAVHTVTYARDGVKYRREYFASHPAGVMVFRFTADKPGSLTGSIAMTDAHKGAVTADPEGITDKGNLAGYVFPESRQGKYGNRARDSYDIALDYEARVRVRNEGGTVESRDGKVFFRSADALTLYLDAGTDYVNRREKKWRGESPHRAITERLAKAAATPYADLLAAHVLDYQSLFNRVSMDLGKSAADSASLPTDRRLIAYRGDKTFPSGGGLSRDPGFEALLFQYGRYLMISSSRPGGLPANLQGRWNDRNAPSWRCDYHSDINVQMNYWFVDAANLGECFLPYAEWLHSVIPVRREDTQKTFGVRGWATHSENGIFGGSTYLWVPGDAAWLLQNIWDHYAFTRDKEYLRTRAYPMLKELCEYWEDSLKERPDGKLVSPLSQSPEHGPRAEGNSYEQQLVYDLFTNYIEASRDLGVDAACRAKIENLRSRLLGPQIGKWGQLQEWAQDLDNPDEPHRHTSHLLAVFPGRQISPLTTPALARAATVSLQARRLSGDGAQSWTWPNRGALWARLWNGEKAYEMLLGLSFFNRYPNLFTNMGVFQIDGNFGYPAAVCEMLLQSHLGEIHLLPALPKAWPTGKVTGLKARGNFTVDIEWKDGKVTHYRITSPEPREVKVRVNGETKTIRSAR